MRRTVSNLIVIGCQLLIVGLFFGTVFNDDIKVEKYVSTIHNNNLDKIATSVSLLFKEDTTPTLDEFEKKLDDMTLEELPSKDAIENEENKKQDDAVEEKKEIESTPLVSVDASKYIDNEEMGFKVTEGNKTYDLNDYEFDVVVAVVSGEFDKNFDDALGVVSVILNRCDSDKWRSWAGSTPYQQVIRAGQFEVYFGGSYLAYMPGGSQYGSQKYNIAKQAVIDGLNGIRNNEYLGFFSYLFSWQYILLLIKYLLRDIYD